MIPNPTIPGVDQSALHSVLGPPPHLLTPTELEKLARDELQRITTAMLNLRAIKAVVRAPAQAKKKEIELVDKRLQALADAAGLSVSDLLSLKELGK